MAARAGGRVADAGADRVYERWAGRYPPDDPRASGYLSPFLFRQERRLVLEAVGADPGLVLDVAGGFGLVTLPLVRSGIAVVGLDYNRSACEGARRNGLQAVQGNAFALPFRDGAFDTATCIEFLQQCRGEDVAALVAELARVVRPGGRIVLVWRNHRAPLHRLALALFDALGRARVPLVEHPVGEVAGIARRAGLAEDLLCTLFQPLGLRFRDPGGLASALLGTSFLAVFRQPRDKP